ncbi:MAG: hypothetical protein M1833_006334 [Piccolia ochrophora]|nr:MAG: hypothetical protein M1833_006334 [Piccolia ochrophora]
MSNTGLAGMNFLSSRRAPKETKKLSRKSSAGGTILKAVPQAGNTSPQKGKKKASDSPFAVSPASSLGSPRTPGLPFLGNGGSGHDAIPLHASIQDADSLVSPLEEESGTSGFLGVWKDGAVLWARDGPEAVENSKDLSEDHQDRPDSGSTEVPVALDPGTHRPKIQLTIPTSHKDPRTKLPQTPREVTTGRRRSGSGDRPRKQAPSGLQVNSQSHVRNFSNGSTKNRFTLTPGQAANSGIVPNTNPESFTAQGLGLKVAPPPPPAQWMSSSRSASPDTRPSHERSSSYSTTSSTDTDETPKATTSRSPRVAYSVMSPTQAGVFDEATLKPMPKPIPMPKPMKKQLSAVELSNKPLPPEPMEMAPAPLLVSGRELPSPPRGVSMSPRKYPLHVSTASDAHAITVVQSHESFALKSDYGATDLDSIDRAFQRTSPSRKDTPALVEEDVSLSEAEEALEDELIAFAEYVPFKWDDIPDKFTDSPNWMSESFKSPSTPRTSSEWPRCHSPLPQISSPLQISRGPMEMAPTRAAPAPPSPFPKLPVTTRLQKKKSTPKLHQVAGLIKAPSRRGSMPENAARRWTSKAHRALKKSSGRGSPISHPVISLSVPNTPSLSGGTTPRSPGTPEPVPNAAAVQERLQMLNAEKNYVRPHFRDYEDSPTIPHFDLSIRPPPPPPARAPAPAPESRRATVVTPQIRIPPRAESDYSASQSVSDQDLPSRMSLAVSEVPEMYVDVTSSPQPTDPSSPDGEKRTIAPRAAEIVLLRILENLENLKDLFSAAVVSKGFYKTFKRHELPLMKNALKCMSPAAWELREMTPPCDDDNELDAERPVPEYTPTTYLKYYTRDLYIMVSLKSLILDRCCGFLRPETVSALPGDHGERSMQLDDAFWRVWTFCRIFGSNKNREDDMMGQLDWLRGGPLAHQETCTSTLAMTDTSFGLTSALVNPPESFGYGNPGGLTPAQLYDMTEIWNCFNVLLQGFHGKREIAREYGIYDNLDFSESDSKKENAMLEEWVSYILSLGPSIILDLAAPSDQPGPQGFALAAEFGLTDWEAPSDGGSRSTFLKEAVTRVYEEQLSRSRSSSFGSSPGHSVNSDESSKVETRQRLVGHANALRARRLDPQFADLPPAEERPISDFHNVLRRIEAIGEVDTSSQSTPTGPQSLVAQPRNVRRQQVDDPLDKAVWKLIGMGFPPHLAKRALAETDTGESLDVDAAIRVCLTWTGQEG